MTAKPRTVPQLTDQRIIKMMTRTGNRNRARLDLATLCCVRLYHSNGKSTQDVPALFAPVHNLKESKAISAEARSRSWQRQFLGELVKREWVKFDVGWYSVVDGHRETIGDLALSSFHGDGLQLKRLLWPSEYPDPEAVTADDTGATEVHGATAHEQRDLLVEALTKVCEDTVSTVGRVKDDIERLEGRVERHITDLAAVVARLGEQVESAGESIRSIAEVAKTFNEASENYQRVVAMLESDERQQLALETAKLAELSSKMQTATNMLSAATRSASALVDARKPNGAKA